MSSNLLSLHAQLSFFSLLLFCSIKSLIPHNIGVILNPALSFSDRNEFRSDGELGVFSMARQLHDKAIIDYVYKLFIYRWKNTTIIVAYLTI